ncbi:Peroxide operon regulator [Apilactobacillus kunkeei]|uniref:Fur family transcriptional regulator n=1 Tax=Apilactobacillus kunkeei TaxID=148814 RepID=UPI000A64C7DC|nr:Fur family transcriptional regulator [Apilactobacillus kunkeei]CAI2634402.1 Peroxide operon regulator [Apilactobacillus kunkeei]CAI2636923.1 Peroxide operon regulator [Apilactobacillus kunkeei]CAI2636983.1 Peroxide operon regulator [Apilactobacillus kunkeei]CAI2637061.1 Peroxide operon regulator [Apilactobacillus kunkeei]CAI2639167.1 Peroxide operon regulator [Apilactobacillus kunkeei]
MSNEMYEKALETLRNNNVRITPQRQIILKYLINHDNHPSVDTIYEALKQEFSNLSIATIYNTLQLFEKLDIIIALPAEDGGIRYDFFGSPHFHAICDNCGKIEDIDFPNYKQLKQELAKEAMDQVGFQTNKIHIEVFGLCKNCREELAKKGNQ